MSTSFQTLAAPEFFSKNNNFATDWFTDVSLKNEGYIHPTINKVDDFSEFIEW